MLRLVRILATLGTARVGSFGAQARTRAVHALLIAVFVALALVFALAAITVALALQIGLLAALVVLCVLCLVAALATYLVLRSERDRRRLERALEREQDRRLLNAAMMATMPVRLLGIRRAGILGLGAAALAAYLLAPSDRPSED